jgi:hypothetical protein
MPFTLELTDQEILKDPTAALFKCNVLIHKRHNELRARAKGRTVCAGDFRGVVTDLDKTHVSVKNDMGIQKSLALTPARVNQLISTQR